ncbi:hypothetical protein QVE09_21015 [Paenibacillus sp. ClWae2A]|uniref:hypothetical protein n=1 Tax=Paenibacillus sp. ClWae2A TaxID=3057177 RepID=UPI0028F5C8A4|nr:hypothetical protein [Paenibacillus sp. ClWae2A]MDT9721386.1 hypothetical protein [Paenibacillus sp. ClWae2A]
MPTLDNYSLGNYGLGGPGWMKYATGNINGANLISLTVTGLNFKPRIIVIDVRGIGLSGNNLDILRKCYVADTGYPDLNSGTMISTIGGNGSGSSRSTGGWAIDNGSFSTRIYDGGTGNLTWWAFE